MRTPTIHMDTDKPCRKCGEKGATQSGLCLGCLGDRVVQMKEEEKMAASKDSALEILARVKRVASTASVDKKTGDVDVALQVVLEGKDIDQVEVKELVNLQAAGDLKISFVAIQPELPLRAAGSE